MGVWAWVGRHGSNSTGKTHRLPNLMSRGFKLKDDDAGDGSASERSRLSEPRTSRSDGTANKSPLAFEGGVDSLCHSFPDCLLIDDQCTQDEHD